MNDRDIREMLPAYTLGTLDPSETAAIEAALRSDPALEEERAQLQRVVDLLPLAVEPVRPPTALKARLMARVAETPQGVVVPFQSATRRSRWTRLGLIAAALLIAVLSAGLFQTSQRLAQSESQATTLQEQLESAKSKAAESQRQLEAAQATAEQLRAERDKLASDLVSARENQERLVSDLTQARAQVKQAQERIASDEQLVAFLSNPDIAARTLRATGEARAAQGTMYMRPGDRDAVVLISGLPTLAAGQTYQFWLASGVVQYNAGVLQQAPDGSAYLLVRAPIEVNRFGEVMVTVEQGSERTTRPAETTVLQGAL